MFYSRCLMTWLRGCAHLANSVRQKYLILPQLRIFSRRFIMDDQRKMKNLIAVTQMTSTDNKEHNWEQICLVVEKAASLGAKIVFLPEGCDFIASNKKQTLEFAEDVSGTFVTKLKSLAKQKNVWISAGGIHLKSSTDTRVSNTHLMISSDGNVVGQYAKTHLFSVNIPGLSLNEHLYVRPGDSVSPPVTTPTGNVGLAICYDLRFPELSQVLRRLGSHILTFPSAFTVPTGKAHWEVLLRSRAIESQCYVVAAAQVGQHNEKRSSYGNAMIIDPWGRILTHLEDGIGADTAEVDLSYLSTVRREMPLLMHSRQDLFPVTLVPQHQKPQLLHMEALPNGFTTYQFGQVTVPGDAVFYNTSLSYAFSNLFPRVLGHSMVSPHRVIHRFTELSAGEVSDLSQLVVITHRLLCEKFNVPNCAVALQDGPKSGQTIEHIHIHLLPQHSGQNALSPDQEEEGERKRTDEKKALMIKAASELRQLSTPELVWGQQKASNEMDVSLYAPKQFVSLPPDTPIKSDVDRVPLEAVCLQGHNIVAYCVSGTLQKCHIIVELRRPASCLSDVRPNEACELWTGAQNLQKTLEGAIPGLSSTFVVTASIENRGLSLHIIPWLVEYPNSDTVYEYVKNYSESSFSGEQTSMATAIRGQDYVLLKSLLL